MRTAPVVIVPLCSKAAYLDRYAEPDKGWTDREEHRWPVPYWYVDTGMASLLILQTAVDEGLGACFFGIPRDRVPALREEFGIPEEQRPVGAITVGHPADDPGAPGSPGAACPAAHRRGGAPRSLVSGSGPVRTMDGEVREHGRPRDWRSSDGCGGPP